LTLLAILKTGSASSQLVRP